MYNYFLFVSLFLLQWLTVIDKALDGTVSTNPDIEVKLMPLTLPASQVVW
jgi:hypothetical protein